MNVIETVEEYIEKKADFDLLELRREVDRASSILGASGFWDEALLYKLNWNAGNIIIERNAISGYVDCEQSFFGNRLALIGAAIDHINVLSWTHARAGLRAKIDSLLDMKLLMEPASYSMCDKIYGCCHDGKIEFFRPGKLCQEFKKMNGMIKDADKML